MAIGISVVVPVKDEVENVVPLANEIAASMANEAPTEIIFVDDGSTDGTADALAELKQRLPQLRIIRHAKNAGQSRSIRTGVRAARFDVIVTLDGDGQNDPADILELWRIGVTAPTTPSLLIAGHREDRQDSWTKRTASQIANRIRRRLLVDDTPDAGCGLKLFPRSLFLDLPYFDHMHRFLPALVLREGGIVRSVRVNHRPRRRGVSKYGIFDRLGVGVVDLFGMIWLKRRAARPYLLDEVLLDSQPTSTPDRISAVR